MSLLQVFFAVTSENGDVQWTKIEKRCDGSDDDVVMRTGSTHVTQ